MPSSYNFVAIVAFGATLIAAQSPYRIARADDGTRPAVQALAAQPSAVADLRGAGGSGPSSGGNADRNSNRLQQDISSETDLATGDGQQRSVSVKPSACADAGLVCKPPGSQQ